MRWLGTSLLVAAALGLVLLAARSPDGSAQTAPRPPHECTFCHGVHGAVPGSELPLGRLLAIEDLCMSCHGPTGSAPRKANVHLSAVVPEFGITCLDCHDPHGYQVNRLGTLNIQLVRGIIPTPGGPERQVVFTSRGSDAGQPQAQSFCDDLYEVQEPPGSGTFVSDSVCDICHTAPRPSRHYYDGTTNHHQNGATCTRCHRHDYGFMTRAP